jgi:glycosyltransferase involved in cell wall biosynthesis
MFVRCLAMMRGGGETRHLAWARELRELGVTVEIVTGRPLVSAPRYAVDDADVTMLRTPYMRDFVYRHQNRRGFGRLTSIALHADEEMFCRAAWRRLATRDRMPDVVHAHALHQAARLRRRNVPVVINLPGAPHARYAHDLAEADALVADGWAARQLPAQLGRAIDRVSKGVDAVRFSPDGPSLREALNLADKRVVVTVARLVPIKNVALLVDAFARVHERVPGAHLLIVGDGPEGQAIRDRVVVQDLRQAVTFTGAVPHAQVAACYRTGDVFALSSDFDNSPNVVLEAMACGLPVVATDGGGAAEFVADPGGRMVPVRDAVALAAAIEHYLVSPDAARAAGGRNRARASTEYSWRESARHLLDVYHRVIERRTSA